MFIHRTKLALISALWVLVSASAHAEEPLFPANADLAQIDEVYTSVVAISVGTAPRCKIAKLDPGSELDVFAAHYLVQFGFPKADPFTLVPVDDSHSVKPSFSVEATATLQRSMAIRPLCLLAMRAEVSFAESSKPRQVYWSSPIVLLEVEAGDDENIPSAELQGQVRSMTRALAEQFVKAWKAASR